MNDLFDAGAAPIPLEAQIECVLREISFRERVYKRRVSEGKMTQHLADEQLAAMRAVLTTLQGLRPA